MFFQKFITTCQVSKLITTFVINSILSELVIMPSFIYKIGILGFMVYSPNESLIDQKRDVKL